MTTQVVQPYNSTSPTGGDALFEDLNMFYSSGDIAWGLTSTALVLLQVPGVGLFYSGLARRKSALSLLFTSMLAASVVAFQWFFWGYTLAFSHSAGPFLGDMANFGFRNVLAAPSVGGPRMPDLLYAVYQSMFAILTVAIVMGAVAERGRILPSLVFMFVWSTLVYDVIACWTWNPAGWLYRLGVYDFAGGTPVHMTSGTAALAYSYMLGRRTGHGTAALTYRPHNVVHIVLGTVLLWVGWFGFNAGSALSASLRAVMAAVVTNLAAAVAGLTWCLLDFRLERKWSAVGFCSGVIAGLVAITPGSGFVPPWAAVVYGVVSGIACNYATKIKYLIRCDDAMDVFAVHAVGGFVGNMLTAIFAADWIAALDGYSSIRGGWVNGHWVQLAIHLGGSAAAFAWSGGMTAIILFLMNLIPGLQLRCTEEDELTGLDEAEVGEYAYDFVQVDREVLPAPNADSESEGASSSAQGDGHFTNKEQPGYPGLGDIVSALNIRKDAYGGPMPITTRGGDDIQEFEASREALQRSDVYGARMI